MKDEIKKAVGAHAMWKARLKNVIDTGKTDVPIETIRKDNECVFGKWLYGAAIPADAKTSDHYKKVKDLHAEFHKVAAHVVEKVISGKKTEAEALVGANGEFTNISTKLTPTMMEWQNKL